MQSGVAVVLFEGKACFRTQQVQKTADAEIVVQLAAFGGGQIGILILDSKFVHSSTIAGSEIEFQEGTGCRGR